METEGLGATLMSGGFIESLDGDI